MRISGGIATAACAFVVSWAGAAAANGRYPASTQVVFSTSASDPDLVVVRTTFGLLVAHVPGPAAPAPAWRWLCEGALGVPAVSIEDPSVALTANDALVIGLAEGLEVSPDLGCTVASVGGPLAGESIVDLATRPGAVIALSSRYSFVDAEASPVVDAEASPVVDAEASPLGDAGRATWADTRVWQSTDDGAHWSQLGAPLDPGLEVTTIDVAKSDPARIYVTATRGFGASRTASLLVSTDTGATWTERPIPFDASTDVADYIGAVDPLSADRVYVRSTGTARLFVTDDAGRTFRNVLTLTGPIEGFALSPDGTRAYAGGPEDGVLEAAAGADAGLAFAKISTLPVGCLAARGAELWACTDAAGGFAVGVSNDGGAWTPALVFGAIAGPVACAAGCDDGGTSGSADGGDPPLLPTAHNPGCWWCATEGPAPPGGFVAIAAAGAVWGARAARRRKR